LRGWNRRFILANGKRHPRHLGEAEVEAFLGTLATEGDVPAKDFGRMSGGIMGLDPRLRRAAKR
jgi:hypothetical protein